MVMDADTQPVDTRRLDTIVNLHAAHEAAYGELRKWWDGDHQVNLTDRLRQFLTRAGVMGDNTFRDNYLEIVVSAMANRMRVDGFQVPGEREGADGTAGPLAQFAADTWEVNRGDALQIRVHETAVALGDAYVILEWDPVARLPRLYFNDPSVARIHYSASDFTRPESASKLWRVNLGEDRGVTVRLNVYYPDRVERWIRNGAAFGGQWRPFTDAEFGRVIPMLMPDGSPLGLPVVHFANAPRGQSMFGRSEILNAIPLQRVLNKALLDGIQNADAQGWPQPWATGVTPSSDALNAAPGSVWEIEDKDAKVGQLDPADPAGIISWMEKIAAEIGNVTSTPRHLFRADATWPSGEAIKTAEAPLVHKIQNRQTYVGNSWEDVMFLGARMAFANRALPALPPPTGFSTQWASAETRPSELDHISAVNAKQGLSTRQRLREYGGYTDEQIERIEAERADDQDEAAAALTKALDNPRGSNTGNLEA